MGEVLRGHDDGDELRKERGWKMLMLLPRMLLARPRGTKSRVRRAETLVHLGELSAGRQALDGAKVAPGNLATLAQLTNPERRPPVPRDLLSGSATAVPERPFELDPELFCKNVRSARRGAAPGPSGMSVEHILGLVESDHDMDIFCSFATIVSQGHVPRGVVEVLRMGRVFALRKLDGGIRGIVVGDIIRRLIARTIAQQISKGVEEATAPHQYTLQTKSGTPCCNMPDGVQVLPFARLFYSTSTHVWEDEMGDPQMIPQGEGGEQGDPLMPLLFSLGQHSALDAVISRLQEGERLFAFLDDLYVLCDPGRVAEVHSILEEELWRHKSTRARRRFGTRVDLFQLVGKTSKPVLACWTPTQSCGEAMGTSQPRSKV